MMVLAYNETTYLATDHISTIGEAASHSRIKFKYTIHSLFWLSCYQAGHVFHFRFLIFEQMTTNGHIYTTHERTTVVVYIV